MYKFEPIVKTIDQVLRYFEDYQLEAEKGKANFYTILKLKHIGQGFPVEPIAVDMDNKHIYGEGKNIWGGLRILVSKDSPIYVDLEKREFVLEKHIRPGSYFVPSYLMFDSIGLLKWQRERELPKEVIDQLDFMHNRLNTYKIVVNEVWRVK